MQPPSRPPKSAFGAPRPSEAGFGDPSRALAAERARLLGDTAPLPVQATTQQANPPPGFLYELGLTCAALGAHDKAIAALRAAVSGRPAMAAAWRKLAELCAITGDATGEAAAKAGLASAGAVPVAVGKTPPAGKLARAEEKLRAMLASMPPAQAADALRQHLMQNPTDVAALRLLAELGLPGGHFAAMEALLERALELAPLYVAAMHNYVFVLLAQSKAKRALPHAERLLAQDPRDARYRMLRAACLSGIGDYARAITAYETVLRPDAPNQARFWLSYAHALKYVGRRDDSLRAYRVCLALAPRMGEPYWCIANIKNAVVAPGELATMRALLSDAAAAPEDRLHLHYALGQAFEQAGDFAGSFNHYAKGAAIKRAQVTYSADDCRDAVTRATDFFTAARCSQAAGHPDPAPIFIVGLPRAGSTLIEQILASHSAVEGTHELPEIADLAQEIAKRADRYPECLCELDAAALAALGARYIERTRVYRKTGKPFFIDKMPGNWLYTGLIHMILPRAKIIDARRHPMASCFSAFKQLFGHGAAYSYDLAELGRYYNDYLRLMAHVDDILPGRVHRVSYEAMVENTEAEIRRLLAYCRLDFEPACLRFWENRRDVATPSAEQVRQPIFRDGLEQWRNFAPWLGDLAAVLAQGHT